MKHHALITICLLAALCLILAGCGPAGVDQNAAATQAAATIYAGQTALAQAFTPTPAPTYTFTAAPAPAPPTATSTPKPVPPTATSLPTPTPATISAWPKAGARYSGPLDSGTLTFSIAPDGASIQGWSVNIPGAVACAEGGTVSGISADYQFAVPIQNQAFEYVSDSVTWRGVFDTATNATGSFQTQLGAGQAACSVGPLQWTATSTSAPTATRPPTATPRPTVAPAVQGEVATLYPFCNCQEQVAASQPVELTWAWLTVQPEQATDFARLTRTSLTLDGRSLSGLDQYWTYSPALATGQGTNRLRVERRGDAIGLSANGQLLATARDDTYTGPRYISLAAESFEVGGVDVRFDNIVACQSPKAWPAAPTPPAVPTPVPQPAPTQVVQATPTPVPPPAAAGKGTLIMLNCLGDVVTVDVLPAGIFQELAPKTGPDCQPGQPILLDPGEYTLKASIAGVPSQGEARITILPGDTLTFTWY